VGKKKNLRRREREERERELGDGEGKGDRREGIDAGNASGEMVVFKGVGKGLWCATRRGGEVCA
jgi:hypothetical protein